MLPPNVTKARSRHPGDQIGQLCVSNPPGGTGPPTLRSATHDDEPPALGLMFHAAIALPSGDHCGVLCLPLRALALDVTVGDPLHTQPPFSFDIHMIREVFPVG